MDEELDQKTLLSMVVEQQKILTKLLTTRFGNLEELSAEDVSARTEANQARKDTELQSRLSLRIKTFVFDLENERTFTEWYERYEDIFLRSGAELSERARLMLLVEKLDDSVYRRYVSEIKPSKPHEMTFEDTVQKLKTLFDAKSSIVTERYKCLKLKKLDSEDCGEYTTRVNEQCEKAKLAELKPEEMKTLFWLFGLVSPSDSDIRTRLLAYMEQ